VKQKLDHRGTAISARPMNIGDPVDIHYSNGVVEKGEIVQIDEMKRR